MAAEEILELFEQNWFFSKHKEHSSPLPRRSNGEFLGIRESKGGEIKPREPKIPRDGEEGEGEEEAFAPPNVLVGRSMSDQILMSSNTSLFGSCEDLFSPTSVLNVKQPPGKLQTIFSGKEVGEFSPGDTRPEPERVFDAVEETEEEEKKKQRKKREVERARRRKSLSDLEFEELKGFMDLGFVFSEEDNKDSDLVSILPGLQRLGRKNKDDVIEKNKEEEEEEERRRSRGERPYLSEAWEFQGKRKEKIPAAMKWKLPAPANEVDLKNNLKLWAHTVASTVR